MFDTTKEDLQDLLSHAHRGRLQLPDFQRDYVWDNKQASKLTSRDREAQMGMAMTDKFINASYELLHLAADNQDAADPQMPGGDGRSERTFHG